MPHPYFKNLISSIMPIKKMFNGRVHTTNVFTFLCFCVLLCSFEANAQTQIAFIYDVAGNQIERKIICVNCTSAAKVEEKLSEFLLKDSTVAANKFQAYPNSLIET